MKIAIDIMGGDNAPQALIEGAIAYAKTYADDQLILVGLPQVLEGIDELPKNVETIPCGSVVAMDEDIKNLINKKDSSVWLATELVKKGQADAIISAGSTGAQMAAATLLLQRIKGCERPAIATIVPTLKGAKLLLDIGANADCTPTMLLSFAQMGAVYAKHLLDIAEPRVVLLSNGTEEHKGNKLTLEAYALIKESGLNFGGNKEGRDVLLGDYDVMVCDGMSGNIALKSIEGTVSVLMGQIKAQLTSSFISKIGALMIKKGLVKIKKSMDKEEFGGAPLLGVKGISIVCHGSSKALAIVNAGKQARKCYDNDFVKKLSEAL